MARIRTIKPEFPHSESMGRVSRDARLLFVLIWTIADDSGRARGASRMLASLLFPYDDDAPKKIDGWIAELEAQNCVVRYRVGDGVDSDTYLEVRNWTRHQRIDKPSPSRIPPFGDSSRTFANPREDSSGDRDLEGIKEGIKDQPKEIDLFWFDRFWIAFDKKVAKPAAEKVWRRIAPDEAKADQIITAAAAYAKATPDKAFRKHPATWLNNECWNDEIVARTEGKPLKPAEHIRGFPLGAPGCLCAECVSFRGRKLA